MKYILHLILAMVLLSSCFGTSRSKGEETQRLKYIRDSLERDSIQKRRMIPDTALVILRRTMVCDKQLMVVFDRVQLLQGNEAVVYAEKHNRFGKIDYIVINTKEQLETLPLRDSAQVYLYVEEDDGTDNIAERNLVRCPIYDVQDLEKEPVLEIVVKERSIIYLKETMYAKD